jgi:cell division protein YceG involved in septum cleavage
MMPGCLSYGLHVRVFSFCWCWLPWRRGAWWWLNQPLHWPRTSLELEIEPGTTPRGVAQNVVKAGVQTDARLLYAWFRLSGKDRAIKAGNYELSTGLTPYVLLQSWRAARKACAR